MFVDVALCLIATAFGIVMWVQWSVLGEILGVVKLIERHLRCKEIEDGEIRDTDASM